MNHLLQLFYSEHCPGCPEAQRRVRQFAMKRSDVTLVERDVAVTVGLARHYGLTATPAIVIDGGRAIYDVPHPDALAALVDGLPATPPASSLRRRSAGWPQARGPQ